MMRLGSGITWGIPYDPGGWGTPYGPRGGAVPMAGNPYGAPIRFVPVPVYVPVPVRTAPATNATASAATAASAPPQPVVCLIKGQGDASDVAVVAESTSSCSTIGGSVVQNNR